MKYFFNLSFSLVFFYSALAVADDPTIGTPPKAPLTYNFTPYYKLLDAEASIRSEDPIKANFKLLWTTQNGYIYGAENASIEAVQQQILYKQSGPGPAVERDYSNGTSDFSQLINDIGTELNEFYAIKNAECGYEAFVVEALEGASSPPDGYFGIGTQFPTESDFDRKNQSPQAGGTPWVFSNPGNQNLLFTVPGIQ